MSTLNVSQLKNPSAASPAIVLAADGSATATLSSINGGPLAGTRNRIINGDMRIDQRNGGASVSTSGGFPVDRWMQIFSGGGVYSAQRSTTAPPGFTNSLLLTVTTVDSSIAASDYYMIRQNIEGFNTADFAFGAAGASSITLSFWVRSSVTGAYGGSITNNAESRSYPFTYAINSANTFEYKTVTISGDTTGTWLTNNGRGFGINFGLGMGSTLSGTAGTWSGSQLFSTTGGTNWIATSGATFYLTGVQLEAGTVATPFERRSYGQELDLCKRYFERIQQLQFGAGHFNGSTAVRWVQHYSEKRAAPTIAFSGTFTANAAGSLYTMSSLTSVSASTKTAYLQGSVSSGTAGQGCAVLDQAGATSDVSIEL
jgi:hypothetical protein